MAIAADDANCDLRGQFGIIPAVIQSYVLRAIGPRHALRYFQARAFGAAEAKAMGLVGEVVTLAELDAAVDRLVQALLACGPQAQLAAKQLIAALAGARSTTPSPRRPPAASHASAPPRRPRRLRGLLRQALAGLDAMNTRAPGVADL